MSGDESLYCFTVIRGFIIKEEFHRWTYSNRHGVKRVSGFNHCIGPQREGIECRINFGVLIFTTRILEQVRRTVVSSYCRVHQKVRRVGRL